MKIEQEVGGSAQTQDAYVGAERQLTVDYDNWDLRLHDGVTPGGHRLINRDNGDERWQAKSVELGGFTFNPEARGYLVRLSAGTYRIRTLRVNTDQLVITNADGYAGNTYIEIAERIETDHIFGGNIIIEGVLQVGGGINADTSGTHYGNVVGDVLGNVTGNLTGNANGNHTGSFTGDVDVTGSTLLLDDNQIATSKIAGLEAFVKANAVPVGVILLWSGVVADIPDGWELCNGLNGTPDLRDKFVIGAGSLSYDPHDAGGATQHSHNTTIDVVADHTHTLTIANHVLTEAELPAHKHSGGVCDNIPDLFNHGTVAASPATSGAIESNGATGSLEGYTSTVGSGVGHTHAGSTADAAGSHTHPIDNPSVSHLPPYYALCYIMRVP